MEAVNDSTTIFPMGGVVASFAECRLLIRCVSQFEHFDIGILVDGFRVVSEHLIPFPVFPTGCWGCLSLALTTSIAHSEGEVK